MGQEKEGQRETRDVTEATSSQPKRTGGNSPQEQDFILIVPSFQAHKRAFFFSISLT
jgi:hypothetical protein